MLIEFKTEDIENNPYILPENKNRFLFDWNLRKQIKESSKNPNSEIIQLEGYNDFWDYYANQHEVSLDYPYNDLFVEPYVIKKPLLICSSKGVESILTEKAMPNADILHIDEANSFVPYSMEGSLPLIGAAMGYAVTLIGSEAFTTSKSSLVLNEDDDTDLTNIELRDSFSEMLNRYTYPAVHHSIVSIWDRDELVAKAFRMGLHPHSCLNYKDDVPYCGDCYKCWSLYVCLKYHGITPPFKMTYKTASKYFKELDDYFDTKRDKFLSVGTFVKMLDNGFDVRNPSIYDKEKLW